MNASQYTPTAATSFHFAMTDLATKIAAKMVGGAEDNDNDNSNADASMPGLVLNKSAASEPSSATSRLCSGGAAASAAGQAFVEMVLHSGPTPTGKRKRDENLPQPERSVRPALGAPEKTLPASVCKHAMQSPLGQSAGSKKLAADAAPTTTTTTTTPKFLRRSCYDPLRKAQRADRAERMYNLLSREDWAKQLESLGANSATEVGSGTYGTAYRLDLAPLGVNFAVCVKRSRCGYQGDDSATAKECFADKSQCRLDKLEPTMASFFSRELLQHCPNFAVCYGYSWGHTTVGADTRAVRQSRRAYLLTVSELGSVSMADRFDQLLLQASGGGGERRGPSAAQQIFALLLQCLATMATLSRVGVSHNDFLMRNVVLARCAPLSLIRYRFPLDLVLGGQISDREAYIDVRTHGWLALLIDPGMASQSDWKETYDGERPLFDCDPRLGHSDLAEADLHSYYYGHVRRVKRRVPPGMRLHAEQTADGGEEATFNHPLSYSGLKDFERDVCGLVSEIMYKLEKAPAPAAAALRSVYSYCEAVLAELKPVRPSTSDEFVRFVHRVTRREFVGRFCAAQCVFGGALNDGSPPVDPANDEYRMPTKREAIKLRKKLWQQLSLPPLYDQMLIGGCELDPQPVNGV